MLSIADVTVGNIKRTGDGSRDALTSSAFLMFDPPSWRALPSPGGLPGWHESSDEDDDDDDSVDPRRNYRSFNRRREADVMKEPSLVGAIITEHGPMVVGNGAYSKLFGRKSIRDWLTVTDLALAVVVLETHCNQWKRLARDEARTGSRMESEEAIGKVKGVRFPGGLNGKAARERYEGLVLYFQAKLYDLKSSEARATMASVQEEVNRRVRKQEQALTPELPGEHSTLTQALQQEGLTQSMERHRELMQSADESSQDKKWAVARVMLAIAERNKW